MLGRQIARKVTRNIGYPVGGLGWSLGTTPDGGPAPVAVITPDSQILPSFYSDGNGYFPTSNTQNSYTGLTTYEGYEGHCVFFDGWGSVSNTNIVSWTWDFGAGTESDEGGRYFSGVNAAHCFETAGTYTVTHTVTDWSGRSSTDTVTVTIHAAGVGHTSMNVGTVNIPVTGTYALTTYYVDAVSGSDANDGKSEGAAWQTLAKVFAAIYKNNASAVSTWPVKPGDRILFKAGQTFNFSAAFSGGGYNLPAGIVFGRYGAGANPLWQWVTPVGALPWTPNTAYTTGQHFISLSSKGYLCRKVTANYTSGDTESNSNNTTIVVLPGFGMGFVGFFDIEINLWDSVGQSGCQALATPITSVRNFALVRCTLRNPGNTVVTTGDSSTPYVNEVYGVFSISSSYNQYEVSTWSVVLGYFGTYIGLALINNIFDKAGNHINYLTGVKHTAICDNVMSRPAFGRTAMRICGHQDVANGAHYNYVARNKFTGWIDDQSVDIMGGANGGGAHNGGGTRYNYTLVTFSPNGHTGMYTEDNIFEDNILTNYEIGMQLMNCKNLKVRNNLFVTPGGTSSAIDIHMAGANNGVQMRPIDNLQIINNTFSRVGASPNGAIKPNIYFGDSTTTGGASTGGLHTNVEIRNNLSVSRAGYGTAFIEYQNAAQIAVTVEDNNLLDTPGAYWAVVEGANVDFNTFKTLYSKDMASLKTTAGVVTPSSGVSHLPGYPNSLAANIAEVASYLAAFQLSPSSVAVNAGTTSTNAWKDNLGVLRPVGVNSDIGAFEYPAVIDAAVLGRLPKPGNISAHWSADSLALANGAAVTEWLDSIGSISASQATPANQPTFQTNVTGGKPSVRFNGSSNKLSIPTPGALKTAVDTQTFTVLITFQQRSNAGGFGSLLSYKNNLGASTYWIADNNRLHRYAMKASGASIPFTALNTFTTFGTTSGPGPRGAGLERAYVNGGCIYSEKAKAPGINTSDWMIGSSVANSFPVSADIFEIVVWNVELTPTEVKQYHAWAADKYGATVPWAGLTYYTVFDGDSITVGEGEVGSCSGIYPYKTAASLGLSYGQWDNLGIGYQTMPEMTSKFASDVAPIATITGKSLRVAAFEWYNQKGTPDPVANSLAYLAAARASGAKVAFGTSTDSSLTPETERANYNAYFDANHSTATMDAYAPIHNNVNIGAEGATTAHPTYFSADKLHLVALGYTELAAVMTTALQAIP